MQRMQVRSLCICIDWAACEENKCIIYELTSKLQYNRALESHCSYCQKNTMGKFNLVDTAHSLTLLLGSSFIVIVMTGWKPLQWLDLIPFLLGADCADILYSVPQKCACCHQWIAERMHKCLSCGRNKYQMQLKQTSTVPIPVCLRTA